MDFRFTTLESEARFSDVVAFDASHYGEKDVDAHTLRAWWNAFPEGIRVALDRDEKIAGAMSGWPLREQAYRRIVGGRSDEARLGIGDFDLDQPQRQRWYLSGIATSERLRADARALLAFFADGLAALGRAANHPAPDMCAVAVSDEGARMLRRFGFEERAKTPLGSVYERIAFRDERIAALARRLIAA